MEINTKYDIGQMVFIVRASGFNNEFYKVEKLEIRNIKLGGKSWETYEIGNTCRGGQDIFTDLEKAKINARIKAKEHYERNIEIIEEQRLNLE
jgi:hypothetical protein